MSEIVLVGKPNCGKSSLFNQLTGLNQKIGNYSGATISEKSGVFSKHQIIDIPGLQSLVTKSPEEIIARNRIIEAASNQTKVLFVANGMQLMDSLLLFSQIADLQLPIILVVNYVDELKINNLCIDERALSNRLLCTVYFLNAKTGEGIDELKKAINQDKFIVPNTFCRSLYDLLSTDKSGNSFAQLLKQETNFDNWERDYQKRKQLVNSILTDTIEGQENNVKLAQSQRFDKLLLHPIWGIFIFLISLLLVFQTFFVVSSYPMDWIDAGFNSLIHFANTHIANTWANQLISKAILPGLGGVIIFIPQIAILFFLIGLLEQVGYMSRISFLADGFLRKFGLSGHSVIPLVSGWACAIPSIMSTKIIENPKERLAVILSAPFMTCSARLPIYTTLISVLIPQQSIWDWKKALILLALYFLGTLATLFLAFLVDKTLRVASNSNWIIELPVFRRPDWKALSIHVYDKTMSFVLQAGKIIFVISLLLWVLSYFSPIIPIYTPEKH
jgi:ferrous iron transport protein B